ncbi:hypothetical protein [Polyangium aurulentum]|uniref:hypothetical protein n=1 Tax=Polyangium aurulentum TaxID=2567896 RepID=UPI0010ADFF98|nr:hypothetical protein [Polyangium aurulentum]UQA58272.1 hypothetical protein E8A73_044680 [Polyangium aurulentum]
MELLSRTWRRRVRRVFRGLSRATELVLGAIATAWFKGRERPTTRARHRVASETADERTMRRIAERQAGGISSQESDARYVSGENPGGLHQKARRPEPDSEEYEIEDPFGRTETHRHTRRTMAFSRRGS